MSGVKKNGVCRGGWAVLLVLVAALGGCRGRSGQGVAADTRSDEELIRADLKDGVGIGLKIPGPQMRRQGEPIALHIAFADLGAKVPIADSACPALNLNVQDRASGVITAASLKGPRCRSAEDRDVYTTALKRGEIKVLNVSSADAYDLKMVPGDYLVSVGWSAYEVGPYDLFSSKQYSAVLSNAVPLVVQR